MDPKLLLDINDIQAGYRHFGVWDYVIFVAMLMTCASIGVYFAFKKTKSGGDAAMEYLMGGRNMSVFPMTMSLIASWASGVIFLGSSTEIYFYGTKYMFICLGFIPAAIVSAYVFLPVFHEMELSSTYEYLEKRFDKRVRLCGSIAFTILMVGWLPIVIYVSALAFNQVTVINLHIISLCVCTVCIFYTTIGGLKAVVWTDVIQTLVMVGAMVLVVVKGTIEMGGPNVVWQRALKGERIENPKFGLDFTDRHTFWSLAIGAGMHWLQVAFLNQNMVQRYMSLPTLPQVKRTVLFFTIGTVLFLPLTCLPGLVLYANYYDCDPLTTGLVKEKDQLLPLFVMQVLGDFPGMPGLFVAGIFSACLSSLSTSLNAMSGVVLQDFVKTLFPKRILSDRTTNIVMKSVAIIFGAICLGMVYVVEKLGTIAQLAISMAAITNGPCFGVFCGGMLLPWMNANGAFYGFLLGLGVSGWPVVGTQRAVAMGQIQVPTKPLSIDGCDYFFNATLTNTILPESDVFPLYHMSYLWYTLFGGVATLVFAMTISYITGFNDPSNMNPLCLSPVIRKYLPMKKVSQTEESLRPELSNGKKF